MSTNERSINYKPGEGHPAPGEFGAAERKHAIDESVKASTNQAEHDVREQAKAALKK